MAPPGKNEPGMRATSNASGSVPYEPFSMEVRKSGIGNVEREDEGKVKDE